MGNSMYYFKLLTSVITKISSRKLYFVEKTYAAYRVLQMTINIQGCGGAVLIIFICSLRVLQLWRQ